MKVDVINTFSDLENIQDEWNQLYTSLELDNPFATFDWVYSWANKFVDENKLFIIVVREESKIIAIAPLMKNNRNVSFLNDSFFADYSEMLAGEEVSNVLPIVINFLTEKYQVKKIDLFPLRSIEPSSRYLENSAIRSKHWIKNTLSKNPYIDTSGDFESFYKPLKKKLRQEVRTTENKLNKLGKWEFKVAQTEEEKTSFFEKLIDFHLKRQSSKAGHSIFDNQKNREFFKSLAKGNFQHFEIQLSAIILNDEIVSVVMNLKSKDTVFYWIPSFDDSINLSSIGKLHLRLLLELCFDEETSTLDFMGGTESYKLQWTNQFYENNEFCYFTNPLHASTFNLKRQVRAKLRDIKNKQAVLQKTWTQISKLRTNS